MKRPGSAEGGGMLASLGGSSKNTGGPAVLKPLAPPPSYTPPQVRHLPCLCAFGVELCRSLVWLCLHCCVIAVYQ